MGDVNRRLSKGKAKATSDGSTSRGHGSRGRHSVSSFPTVPDHLIGDAMTDEEFNQIYSGRGDANLPTLDSLFEDVDEAGLDNLDGDDEPTPQSNDVDAEACEPETSRGPDKGKKKYKSELFVYHFDKDTKDDIVYGTCKHCGTVIKMGVSGSYGGPEKHLRSRHPVEYAKYEAKKKGRQEVQTQISRFANRGKGGLFAYSDEQNRQKMAEMICEENLSYMDYKLWAEF
ncbi:unnamed protein product [Cuscuta campestris]|uniref:BED-type domain-containing protein n=1 Tax=Cuscuta campestris TaxID=132261 RepID=A0A484KBU1_9ASTE|nr:unnamed protein product [Cuscuta campestris]